MRTDKSWKVVDLDRACSWLENLFLQSNFAVGALVHGFRDGRLHQDLLDNANAIFGEAEVLTEERGARFLVLFVAAPWECEKQTSDLDLGDLASKHASMLPHCAAEDLAFPHDGHFSPQGNRWFAKFLAEQLGSVVTPR